MISHRGRTYEPLIKRYPETFCDPDGDIEIIGDVPHQKCLFEQHYQNYCFTRKEDVTIPYLSTSGRPRLYSHIIKMRTGCRCAEPDVRRKRWDVAVSNALWTTSSSIVYSRRQFLFLFVIVYNAQQSTVWKSKTASRESELWPVEGNEQCGVYFGPF